ncbi:snRNA-activating protein complex subunit 1 [Nephila pilipes]|uniref:snRNA-activating protein complex subunit 1 n=1 Tax=Nephila pilipes TaxID=299642 RepID=A0A8X6P2W5_NEPPI|nr:snRNA-activating protein complex subunit 1 [Nephila pilipes]
MRLTNIISKNYLYIMRVPKYVAAGFSNDAEKLMMDFLQETSPEFSVFAAKWKACSFAAIYLGRQKIELQQFTQEIFQITLKYLKSTSIYRRIGTTYLLYALFRSQILDPPIKIRIVLEEFKVFQELQVIAVEKNYKTLHYVIDFLIKNAFDFVANGTLFGPKTSRFYKEHDSEFEFLLNDFKGEMAEIIDDDIVKEVNDLNDLYVKIKSKFQDPKWTECLDFKIRMQALRDLLGVEIGENTENTTIEQDDIGARRAKLKLSSFSQRALFRQLNASGSDEERDFDRLHICPKAPKRGRGRRRNSRGKKKMGRPSCIDKLEEMLVESSCDESKPVVDESKSSLVRNDSQRKRGPISRCGYLEYYDDTIVQNAEPHLSESSPSPSPISSDEDALVF